MLPAEPHPRLDTGDAKTVWAPDDIVTLSWVTASLILSAMLALTLRAGLHERLAFLHEDSVLANRVQLVRPWKDSAWLCVYCVGEGDGGGGVTGGSPVLFFPSGFQYRGLALWSGPWGHSTSCEQKRTLP